MNSHLIIADLDVNSPNIVRTGIEYAFITKMYMKMVSLRLGLQPAGRNNSLLSVGVGSELPFLNTSEDYQFSLDYAMIPLGELGYNHAVTFNILVKEKVSVLFGMQEEPEELEEKIEEKKTEEKKAEQEISEDAMEIESSQTNIQIDEMILEDEEDEGETEPGQTEIDEDKLIEEMDKLDMEMEIEE